MIDIFVIALIFAATRSVATGSQSTGGQHAITTQDEKLGFEAAVAALGNHSTVHFGVMVVNSFEFDTFSAKARPL